MKTFTTQELSKIVEIDTSLLDKMTRCTKVTITGKLISVYERKNKQSKWYNRTEIEKLQEQLKSLQNRLRRVPKHA